MIDDECGAASGMITGRGNRSTRRKPAPVPLCPPQIQHDLTWARARAAAVGSRWLTVLAMQYPLVSWYFLPLRYMQSLHAHSQTRTHQDEALFVQSTTSRLTDLLKSSEQHKLISWTSFLLPICRTYTGLSLSVQANGGLMWRTGPTLHTGLSLRVQANGGLVWRTGPTLHTGLSQRSS
jgi:hypothetical protein